MTKIEKMVNQHGYWCDKFGRLKRPRGKPGHGYEAGIRPSKQRWWDKQNRKGGGKGGKGGKGGGQGVA